jgi:hypothetical protein
VIPVPQIGDTTLKRPISEVDSDSDDDVPHSGRLAISRTKKQCVGENFSTDAEVVDVEEDEDEDVYSSDGEDDIPFCGRQKSSSLLNKECEGAEESMTIVRGQPEGGAEGNRLREAGS